MIDLLVVGAEQQAAVLQRLDDLRRQRIAAGGDAGDAGIGVVVGIGGELGERLLVALGAARELPASEQQDAAHKQRAQALVPTSHVDSVPGVSRR